MGKMITTRATLGHHNVELTKVHKSDWNESEKRKLLSALRRYGHRNVDALVKRIPTKTKEQIRLFIDMRMKATRLSVYNNIMMPRKTGRFGVAKGAQLARRTRDEELIKAPIDRWLLKMEAARRAQDDSDGSDLSQLLAKSMLYISRFEAHPNPSDCGGVNYRELYEFMYLLLSGYPPKELSKPNATMVMDDIARLSEISHSSKNEVEGKLLDKSQRMNYRPVSKEVRQYGKRKRKMKDMTDQDPALDPVKNFATVRGINPMNIPVEVLTKPRRQMTLNQNVSLQLNGTVI